jgi:hypothetical protein
MMKRLYAPWLWLFLLAGTTGNADAQGRSPLPNVYRVDCGTIGGFNVWIVDGKAIREVVIPEFLYGGNHERYQCVPADEIWIDHAISCEEYHYTLIHELCERELMAKHGWTYGAAHDSALMIEQHRRQDDYSMCAEHERQLRPVSPTDCDGAKECMRLGDSVHLHGVYRVRVGKRDSVDVWIVDGAAIRRDVFPDFGLSGNDRAYHFIPPGEIWLDAQISCEEMEFSIAAELAERTLMVRGMPYDDAYEKSLMGLRRQRIRASRKAAAMPTIRLPKGQLQQ